MSPIPSMNATRSNSGSYKNQAPGIALTPHLIPCCKLHPPAIEDDHHRGDCCFRVIDENSSIPDTSSTVSTSMHSDSLEKDDDLIRRSRRPKDKHQQEPADRGGTDSDKHCDSKQLTSIRSDPTTNTTSSTTTTTATTTFRQSADELMRYERKYSRYCHVVSQSYQKMGIWYLQMEDPTRSVIMHRASYRIDVFLYGATTNGALSVYFRQALTNRGVPEDDFITIQKCVTDSVHLEMRGDMLRQFGMAQRAAHEYQKAVKVEESAFGRENPCLATLWRKLVCLAVVIRADTSHWSKDIDEMDRLDGPWLKQQYNSKAASVEGAEKTDNRDGRRRRSGGILPANVGRAIEQGDACYQAMDFAQAVGRYSHAVAIHKSRRPSSRSTSSSSRDRNRSGKDRSSRSRSRSVSKEVPHHGSKSPRRRGTRGETRPTNNPKSAEEKVDNEHAMQEIKKLLNDSKFAKKKRDGVVASTVLHSDSNQPRMEQRSMEAPSPPPSSSSSLPVHHQTVISTSTRRVKRNHSNSTSTRSSSMYQAIRNYVDPQRPKSDSHVTKLAKKVVRKTSKHIRKTLGGSSIHGGTANRPSKSTTKEDGDDEDDDAESLTEPSRPKSESYAYLASPPMTPLVNNTTAKLSDILKVSSPTTSSNHHRGSVEFYGEDEDEDDGHYFYQPSTSTTSHRRNSAIKPPTAGTVTRDGLEALINGCLEKSGLNQLVQKLEDSPTSEIQREETLTGDEAVTMTHMPGNIGCVGIAKSSILHCEFGQRTILNMSNTNMQKRLSDFRYLMQLVEKRVEEKGKWIAHPSIEQANEMFEAGSSFKLEGYLEPVNANVKECKISLGCFPTGDSYLNHG